MRRACAAPALRLRCACACAAPAFHCMSQIPKRAKGVEDPGAMRTEPNLRGTGGVRARAGGPGSVPPDPAACCRAYLWPCDTRWERCRSQLLRGATRASSCRPHEDARGRRGCQQPTSLLLFMGILHPALDVARSLHCVSQIAKRTKGVKDLGGASSRVLMRNPRGRPPGGRACADRSADSSRKCWRLLAPFSKEVD